MNALFSDADQSQSDWTGRQPCIRYQSCSHCQATWYFKRGFCPRCGVSGPDSRTASGTGHVYAVTQVTRAPIRNLASYTPYCIVLVDAVEGFRLMAHGDLSLRIGDAVTVNFKEFGTEFIPHFTLTQSPPTHE